MRLWKESPIKRFVFRQLRLPKPIANPAQSGREILKILDNAIIDNYFFFEFRRRIENVDIFVMICMNSARTGG